MLENAKKIYVGMTSGNLATFDLSSKILEVIGHRKVNSPDDSTLYDVVLCEDKTIAVIDCTSQVMFFYKGKKLKTLEDKGPLLSSLVLQVSSSQIGKQLCAEGGHIYFINEAQNGIVKVNTATFDRLKIPLVDDRIYQISVASNRVYAISENGSLQVLYRTRDKVLGEYKKKSMKDSDDEDLMSDDEGQLDKYKTKLVMITPNKDTVQEPDPLNSSIIAGSDHEDGDETPHSISQKSKSELHICNQNSTDPSYFYRTIEANNDYVVAVAHDGTGINHLFVFNAGLDQLAEKIIAIKKNDFSINTSTLN